MTFRIATWNVEWADPGSTRGLQVARVLESVNADVIVLTEGYSELLPAQGFQIDGGSDWGYQVHDSRRRKVIMWSRRPWENPSTGNDRLPPGRFVEGITQTDCGEIRVFGVCVPWRDAHVRTGRGDRKIWEDHLGYLEALKPLVSGVSESLVVAGDYNQRIPRRRAPLNVFRVLSETFESLRIATGTVEDDPMIDHVAHSCNLEAVNFEIIPSMHNGHRLTDHRGLFVDLCHKTLDIG